MSGTQSTNDNHSLSKDLRDASQPLEKIENSPSSISGDEPLERAVENPLNDSVQDGADESDIPPMPDWRKEKRKPFLEKSTRSNWDIRRDKIRLFFEQSPVRPQLIIIILLVLIIIVSIYYLLPKEKSENLDLERAWKSLDIPKIERDSFIALSKQKSTEQKLLDIFLDDEVKLVHSLAYLEHEQPKNIATPLVLRTSSKEEYKYEEQMALLDLYLAKRSEDNFVNTTKEIKAKFPQCFSEEEAEVYWPEHLAYLRRLFSYSELWETREIDEEILRESELLYPIFSQGLKGRAEEFSERKNDYFYSTEEENYDGEYTIKAVHLAKLDLWVLQCLSTVDEEWQPIYEKWLEIVKAGKLDSGFYAYAWNSEEETYLPSAGESFRSESKSSLQQLKYLAELGEAKAADLNLYDDLIQASMGFYTSYNSVSLAPWDDTYDLDSLILYQYIADKLDSTLAQTLAKEALNTYRDKRSDSPAQSLFFQERNSADSFNFANNVQAFLESLR